MSSILTNTSAMTALQTLKNINTNLAKTQDEISTGKTISSAKDNAAVWSISKVMESDVNGISAIKSSLDLGESSISVARQAAEEVVSKLTDMQALIVNAQSESVDRTTLQTQIANLRDDIRSTVSGAQLNGLNMLDGSGTADVKVLSALNRDASGNVTTSTIDIKRLNLSSGEVVSKAGFDATNTDGVSTSGETFGFTMDPAGTGTLALDTTATFAAGDTISLKIGDQSVSYTVTEEDAASTTPADMIAVGLKNKIDALGISDLSVDYDSATPGTLSLTNGTSSDLSISGKMTSLDTASMAAGSLSDLATIDVTTDPAAALEKMTALLKTATDAASYYGAMETRLSDQSDFLSKLSDAMTTGIGSLVDADMEEASARLTALQTQQQLGIQALSIANQTPQSILSLFQ